MANENDGYKKGVDFEMRPVKDKNGKVLYTNRHFYTKAEKAALNPPKAAPAKSSPAVGTKKPAATSKAKPKKPAATSKAKPNNTAEIVSRASKAIDRATKGDVANGGATGRWGAPNKMPARPVTPTPPRLSTVTEAEWDGLSRAERGKKGLPTSWVDYVKAGGDAVVKKPKPIVAKAPNRMEAFKLQQKKK
jgi:hypothetical protein